MRNHRHGRYSREDKTNGRCAGDDELFYHICPLYNFNKIRLEVQTTGQEASEVEGSHIAFIQMPCFAFVHSKESIVYSVAAIIAQLDEAT
ncbi:hypothetical protein KIN20_013569 [Parelaphostrongylus tenuis]|uniref:Uncharacterized protein n=1 Tax=Parelaphostrongylus tenuis TaxID=148309 RepID=A0AAD5MGW0_PARTN|nr:hypothetical protein KIN20_013569 [Parelaphostrongylus tenuis]